MIQYNSISKNTPAVACQKFLVANERRVRPVQNTEWVWYRYSHFHDVSRDFRFVCRPCFESTVPNGVEQIACVPALHKELDYSYRRYLEICSSRYRVLKLKISLYSANKGRRHPLIKKNRWIVMKPKTTSLWYGLFSSSSVILQNPKNTQNFKILKFEAIFLIFWLAWLF